MRKYAVVSRPFFHRRAHLARELGEAQQCIGPAQHDDIKAGLVEPAAEQAWYLLPEIILWIVGRARN